MWLYILVAVLSFLYFLMKPKPKLPPGPPALPILGSMPFMKQFNFEGLTDIELKEKYGDLTTVHFPTFPLVIINNFDVAKELFNMHDLSFRHSNYVLDHVRGEKGSPTGIIFTEGPIWTEQRRFSLKTLRDLGFGKNKLDKVIQDEALFQCDAFVKEQEKNNKVFLEDTCFNASIINILWYIVGSKKFDLNDDKTKEMMMKVNKHFRASMDFLIFLGNIKKFLPYSEDDKYLLEFKQKFRDLIIEHEEDHDPESPPRDFIDSYLTEMKTKNNSHFSREQLVGVCMDFFEAGTETSSTTLRWAVMYMALYPEVQKRCQREIDEVLGSRLSVKDDMPSLVYVQATIMEIQRLSSVAPGSLFHKAHQDVQYKGYTFPKHCNLMCNLRQFMIDPKVFTNPKEFDPDRFIENGKIKHYDQFVPFGIGKRICMGETLAKHEIFSFFTILLQQCNIGCASGEPKPDANKYEMTLTCMPDSYYVAITKR